MAAKTLVPEAFENVEGKPLLQPECERVVEEAITEARGEIEKRMTNATEPDLKIESDLAEKIQILRENIEKIVKSMNKNADIRRQYLDTFQKRKELNGQTVNSLNSIKGIIQKHRKKSNIARVVGYSTSLIGGSLCVTSAALAPVTFGLSLPFGIAGGSMIATGSATAVGTSITENVLLRKEIKAAQAVVEENRKASKGMNEFLIQSQQVAEAVDNIMKIELFKDIISKIEAFVINAAKMEKNEVRILVASYIVLPILAMLPVGAVFFLKSTLTLIGMIVAFIFLRHGNKIVVDCGTVMCKAVVFGLSFTNSVIDMGVAVANLVAANVAKNVGVAIARGGFAILSMVLDIVSLTLHSIDIRKGSTSKEAEKICQLVSLLQQEEAVLQQVYDNLMREHRLEICRRKISTALYNKQICIARSVKTTRSV